LIDPYKDFFQFPFLVTILMPLIEARSKFHYTFVFIFKNAFLTFGCCIDQSKFSATENRTSTRLSLAIGVYVYT